MPTLVCPTCGHFWVYDPPEKAWRQCSECARAQADSDDEREDRRQDER